MVIHPYIPKRKPRKPNAKQRAQKASWQALLDKYDIKPTVCKSTKLSPKPSPTTVYRRECNTHHIPSLDTGKAVATKKEVIQYTGDAMLGISVLHKSNGIPVFRQEDILDISKMRRG